MNYKKCFQKHLDRLRTTYAVGPNARFFRDSENKLHYGVPESELLEMAHQAAQADLDGYSSVAA